MNDTLNEPAASQAEEGAQNKPAARKPAAKSTAPRGKSHTTKAASVTASAKKNARSKSAETLPNAEQPSAVLPAAPIVLTEDAVTGSPAESAGKKISAARKPAKAKSAGKTAAASSVVSAAKAQEAAGPAAEASPAMETDQPRRETAKAPVKPAGRKAAAPRAKKPEALPAAEAESREAVQATEPAKVQADDAAAGAGQKKKPGARRGGSKKAPQGKTPSVAPVAPVAVDDASPVVSPELSHASGAESSTEPSAGSSDEASGGAAETGETAVPSKSRRSRTRRGRRKSAAARAAAAEAAGSNGTAQDAAEQPATLQPVDDPNESRAEPGPEPEEGAAVKDAASGSGGRGGKKGQAGKNASKKDAVKKDGATASAKEKEAVRGKSKMFVSVLPGEQVEVIVAEDGQVQEYYVEMLHQVKVKGNIYKGVIHNVDPNLQAAFVSYGAAKNGFLQIDEVHPEYYLAPHEVAKGHKYPLIQKVLKPGQEILVQVVKEPSGTKGAFLTSYLSLPGRFLVLTPGREQIGVSRKVDSEEERARLREMLNGLDPGEGLGVIVRTVSRGATKTSLQRDLQLLKRVWKDVRKKGSSEPAPSLIYQELGLDTRAVRDYLTEEVSELWVDDEEMAGQIRELVSLLFPRRTNMVQVHKELEQTLFERFGFKKQLEQVHSREVNLPSGGRLVFDHTEALMAIDINSGRAAGKSNFEDTAFKTNLEAAQQIPLQLRLRDIGGQIVVDFIEMRDRGHWREVEKAIRNGMKVDRARHDVGKISSFGLLEIVRQRLSSSAISITTEPCPSCRGTGQRRNMEWQSLQALREIRALLRKNSDSGNGVVYCGPEELVLYLLNNKRERLLQMEKDYGVKLDLRLSLDNGASGKGK